MRAVRYFAIGVLAIAAGAAIRAQQPPDATRTFTSPADYAEVNPARATPSELRDLVDRFNLDRSAIQRFYTIPGSTTRRERLRAFYDTWLAKLPAVRFDALSQEAKVDYVLLRNRIEYERTLLGREERVRRETGELVPFFDDVALMQEDRQRLSFVTGEAAATLVRNVAAKVEATRARVDGGLSTSPAVALRAAEQVDLLSGALGQWFNFYNGYDPTFTAAVPPAYQSLTRALSSYAALLREKIGGLPKGAGQLAGEGGGGGGRGGRGGGAVPTVRSSEGPIVGDPIGREGLLEDLRGEMIAYTPEQLIEIGNREYAWCEAEMKKASREMGFGDDWMKALEKVKNIYVPRGEQPQLVRNLALEAVAFLKRHDLVTVPPLALDQWRMTMMPAANQRVNPFFLGGESIQVSYPTDTMSEEDSLMVMRGNGPHFSRATVFHELIPGHSLQGFMAARYNPHRALFSTPFLTEGWALYWEFVMWDQGFPRSPEDRIGMLFWRMHRAGRILFSLNFHLGNWTPQQCVDFLVDRVGHERFTAEGEVRRSLNGSYSPLYQVAYMMGALQIRALMNEVVGAKKMTLKAFNDAFLHEGQMPIEMMRAALTSQPLTRDYSARWKYYGELPAR
jgi:uncharacterized protein (DUF885 family)